MAQGAFAALDCKSGKTAYWYVLETRPKELILENSTVMVRFAYVLKSFCYSSNDTQNT